MKLHSSWEDKLDAFISILSPKVRMTSENLRTLFTGIYYRFKVLKNYDVSKMPKVRAPITLFKASVPLINMEDADYGVSKVHLFSVFWFFKSHGLSVQPFRTQFRDF